METGDLSTGPIVFKVNERESLGLELPAVRYGESLRTLIRWLPGTMFQKEALVTSSRTGATWRLASDEGPSLGGDDLAPPPLSNLTVGMVCSYMNEILALAEIRSIEVESLRLTQDNFYTFQAGKGPPTDGAVDVELGVEIATTAGGAELDNLLHDAIAASPLNGLLRGCNQSRFSLIHNGAAVEPSGVPSIDGPPLPDQAGSFDAVQPAAGDWASLVTKTGRTSARDRRAAASERSSRRRVDLDRYEHEKAGDGVKLQVHLRGVCSLREDGLKEIDVTMLSPSGSSGFRFLSEEDPAGDGSGRAPDANTYVSAGIAFCFMSHVTMSATQAETELEYLRVVEDTHFSLGGASGGTGKAGTADPVETHLHLGSAANDEFAQALLEGAERSCFLHALCRTDVKTTVRVKHETAQPA